MPPNKALQLTGRRFGACAGAQPPAAGEARSRFRMDSAAAGRSPLGTLTGGRQLSAGPLGSTTVNRVGTLALAISAASVVLPTVTILLIIAPAVVPTAPAP